MLDVHFHIKQVPTGLGVAVGIIFYILRGEFEMKKRIIVTAGLLFFLVVATQSNGEMRTTPGHLEVETIMIGTGWGESIKGILNTAKYGAGVYGVGNGPYANGVAGGSTGANGAGVYGESSGSNGMGIKGHAHGTAGIGVYGEGPGWGGYFEGNIYTSGSIHIPSNSNIVNADGRAVFHTGWSGTFGDYTAINSGYDWGSGEPVSVIAGKEGVFFTKGDASGNPYSEILVTINTSGRLITNTLQLLGGSDIAEPFDIRKGETVKPGMIMAIDPEHAGQLMVSDRAYDYRVAGVVSGANGINPGMIMSQEGSTLQGSTLIALSGRVYCLADATQDPIRPGDMLTSSDVPGHAMKADDREKCFGAVIGKAMTSLEKGKGLVLVLVNLQ